MVLWTLVYYVKVQETPFTCSDKTITPGLSYLILFVGGEYFFTLPFPIFDLVHVQLISFYPVTELPNYSNEENSCYLDSSYPLSFGTGP